MTAPTDEQIKEYLGHNNVGCVVLFTPDEKGVYRSGKPNSALPENAYDFEFVGSREQIVKDMTADE